VIDRNDAYVIELAAYALLLVVMVWKNRQLVREVEATARAKADQTSEASDPPPKA